MCIVNLRKKSKKNILDLVLQKTFPNKQILRIKKTLFLCEEESLKIT